MPKNNSTLLSHTPLFWGAGAPLPAAWDAAPRHAETGGWSVLAQLSELASCLQLLRVL